MHRFTQNGPAQDPLFRLRAAARNVIERLEERTLFSLPGLPILNSLPGAPTAVYLDFDGGTYTPDNETYGAYNISGSDPNSFDANEQARITFTWQKIANYFAPFNVNVTTDETVSVPRSWMLLSYDVPGAGGEMYFDAFPNTIALGRADGQNVGTQSGADLIAHEIGHGFSLPHASSYSDLGENIDRYTNRLDQLHGSIMGGRGTTINKFVHWHGESSLTNIQDEMEIIRAEIDAQDGSGDGYRPDDDPDGSLSTPIALTIGTPTTGVIERLNDADVYSVTVPSGGNGNYAITVRRDDRSFVDTKIEVYNNSGTLIASQDGDPKAAVASQPKWDVPNDQHLSMFLGVGTFKIKVMSHGNYADQGKYIVRVDKLKNGTNVNGTTIGWSIGDMGFTLTPGYSTYNSGTDTITINAGGGNYATNPGDEGHYLFQTLTGDGSVAVKVTSVTETEPDWAFGGITIRESLSPDAKNATLAMTYGKGAYFSWRATTGADATDAGTPAATTFTPTWLRLTRSGNTFTAESSTNSTNGVDGTWTPRGSQSITMATTTPIYIGLIASAYNSYIPNVTTFTGARFAGNVGVGPASNSLSAPTLTMGTTTYNSIALSWTDPNSSETGYLIERAPDGADYSILATTAANTTSFTDTTVNEAQRYWYLVRPIGSGSSVGAASARKNAVTRAGPVWNARVIPASSTKLTLEWHEASGETDYVIERSPNGTSSWTNLGTVGANKQLFVDSATLSSGTQYWYRITSRDASGNSANVIVSGRTLLADITNLTFTSKSSTSMALDWGNVTGATYYEVYKWNLSTQGWDLLASPTSSAYTDTAVSPYDEVYYTVTPFSSSGNTSRNLSNEAAAAVPATTAQALPSGWTANDIGAVHGSGAAGRTSGVFTLVGSGTDIDSTSDIIHYVSASTSNSWAYLDATLESKEDTSSGAIAGVMIRESLNADSKYFAMYLVTGGGVFLQYRTTTGGTPTSHLVSGPDGETPMNMNVTRVNSNTWEAWYGNGTEEWVRFARTGGGSGMLNLPSFSMNSTVRLGVFVGAGNNTDFEHATFSGVFTPAGGSESLMAGGGGGEGAALGKSSKTSSATDLVRVQPKTSFSDRRISLGLTEDESLLA